MKVSYKKSDYTSKEWVFRFPVCGFKMPEPGHGIHFQCESCDQKMVAYGNSLELFYRKGNVMSASGKPKPRTIGEMKKGDSAWAIPAAYNRATNMLDEGHHVYETPGKFDTMLVRCVKLGRYEITFNVR